MDNSQNYPDHIFMLAVENGCQPFWWDGIYGWAWHCNCPDLRHACDQQCSMITTKSAIAPAQRDMSL